MKLVDIGANLAHKRMRGDLDAILARSARVGISAIVITGTSAQASRAAWEIAEARSAGPVLLRSTAGIHPHEARTFGRDSAPLLRALLARSQVVAVGECGLDHDRLFSTREEQLLCFEAQIDLAAELRLPLFLHEREAHEDFAALLARHRSRLVGGVVHCFTGDERALLRYLDLDLHIGITGFFCDERRGGHLAPLVARIPAGRLMLETDAPFLLPRTLRPRPADGRNEPAFLPHVLAAVASCRGEDPRETARHTSATARSFFGLGEERASDHAQGSDPRGHAKLI